MHQPGNGFRLRERYPGWALVTGASSGIGRAFATALAADGMNAVIVSNQEEELQATADDLRQRYGVEVIACCTDLSQPGFIDTIRQAVDGRGISILINDASVGLVGDFLAHDIEKYQSLINVNITAYLTLTHEFLPQMLQMPRGALIFVSSLNALSPIGRSAAYTASKAFELYFGGALWQELRGKNVDVLVVLPGPTKTGFQQKAGTKVASWAIAPEELVAQALPALGKSMLFIPDLRNNLIVGLLSRLSMERKVIVASRLLEATLIVGDEQSASAASP